MMELDLGVILSVVRPERTARQCVEGLRRAVNRASPGRASRVPLLTELPLTNPVRKWADLTLASLDAVKTGATPPEDLVYATLEGPPGTGKTLIAESLARTAGWSFVPATVGSWFVSGDGALGGVAKNVRAFVDEVLAKEPSIGFLDEIDALPDRATLDSRSKDWWLPVITLFLTEIDRARSAKKKVLLLAATNYYQRLDDALIRPGRLHRRVSVMPPKTDDEVIAVLRHYLPDEFDEVGFDKLARLGRGATPAAIAGFVKEARSLARSHNRSLMLADVLEQMVPHDDRSPADIRAIALHEIGHAVVAHRVGQIVKAVSIVPEGATGGRTETRTPSLVSTWREVCNTATVALGGRAADIVVGGGANTGAEADLAYATKLLRDAIERQGLGGNLVFIPELGNRSSDIGRTIEDQLQRLLKRAIAIVEADRVLVLRLAEHLVAERVLSGDDIANMLGDGNGEVSPEWPLTLAKGRGLPGDR